MSSAEHESFIAASVVTVSVGEAPVGVGRGDRTVLSTPDAVGLHERHELAVDDFTDAAGDLADLGQRLIESEAGEQRTVIG